MFTHYHSRHLECSTKEATHACIYVNLKVIHTRMCMIPPEKCRGGGPSKWALRSAEYARQKSIGSRSCVVDAKSCEISPSIRGLSNRKTHSHPERVISVFMFAYIYVHIYIYTHTVYQCADKKIIRANLTTCRLETDTLRFISIAEK